MGGFRIDGPGNSEYVYNSAAAASRKEAEKNDAIVRPKVETVPTLEPKKLNKLELSPEFEGLNGVPSKKTLSLYAPAEMSPNFSNMVLAMADALKEEPDDKKNSKLLNVDTEARLPDFMDKMLGLDFMA